MEKDVATGYMNHGRRNKHFNTNNFKKLNYYVLFPRIFSQCPI